jgi:ABC-type nickel/cobalt efflux system permease component RcnA
MMLALTSGRAAVGLYLITVFSIGLATALMTVGIVMVRSRRFFDRYTPNSRFVQVLPVLSSVIILLVGCAFLVNGLVKHGILEIHLG